MKRVLIGFLLPLLLLAASLSGASGAAGATSKAAYSWHVADELLQENAGSPPWAIAEADNGDRVLVRGTGAMDGAGKTASGGGVFEHRRADGTLVGSGTFTANRLLSFQFYGCEPFAETQICGGLAKLDVTLTPDANPSLHVAGTLWIDCLIGDFPPNRQEGIRLNVKDALNFNKTVHSGFTVFIPA